MNLETWCMKLKTRQRPEGRGLEPSLGVLDLIYEQWKTAKEFFCLMYALPDLQFGKHLWWWCKSCM